MTTKRHQIICLMGLKNVNFGVKRTGLGEEGRGRGSSCSLLEQEQILGN